MIEVVKSKIIDKPLFSIGITTYNRIEMLRQLVNSIINQDFQDFEIIIGNDYQKELLTFDILGIYDQRIRIINHQENLGELGNMNFLLSEGKGRYFTWQFDDDLCGLGYLRESYLALNKFNFPSCVLSSYSYVYGSGIVKFKKVKKVEPELFSGRTCVRNFLSGGLRVSILAAFYDIQFLRQAGGARRFSKGHIALYSEFFLLFQVGLLPRVAYINSPLTLIRVHGGSFSSSARELELHKDAGINLIRESMAIFAHSVMRDDFQKNLSSLLKSVICNVIVKSEKKRDGDQKLNISEYILLLKNEIESLKKLGLNEEGLKSIENARKHIIFFIIKSRVKALIPDEYLKLVRLLASFVSPFTNKSF